MSDDVHKLIIKPRSAKTLCGLRIQAFYPQTNTALKVGDPVTIWERHLLNVVECNDNKVTCPRCIKRM